MRKKMLAAFAAAALAAAPALAEPWTKGYGGSGADRLTELVEYEGGLNCGRADVVGRRRSGNAHAQQSGRLDDAPERGGHAALELLYGEKRAKPDARAVCA